MVLKGHIFKNISAAQIGLNGWKKTNMKQIWVGREISINLGWLGVGYEQNTLYACFKEWFLIERKDKNYMKEINARRSWDNKE